MKGKRQKVDCCSNGGAGWSARRKDRTECESCKTTVEGIHHTSLCHFIMSLETQLDWKEICLTKSEALEPRLAHSSRLIAHSSQLPGFCNMKRLEVILTTLTRDIQCEKFFEPGMSQSAMSSAIQCILCYARYEKPLKPPFRCGQKIRGNVFLIYCSSTRPRGKGILQIIYTNKSNRNVILKNKAGEHSD